MRGFTPNDTIPNRIKEDCNDWLKEAELHLLRAFRYALQGSKTHTMNALFAHDITVFHLLGIQFTVSVIRTDDGYTDSYRVAAFCDDYLLCSAICNGYDI